MEGIHGDDGRVLVEDCTGGFVGDVDFLGVPDSGRSLEIIESEAGASETESCSSLGRGDGAELGILAQGRVRGADVSLGLWSFGAAEILILLCGAADEVVAPLEGAPLFLH